MPRFQNGPRKPTRKHARTPRGGGWVAWRMACCANRAWDARKGKWTTGKLGVWRKGAGRSGAAERGAEETKKGRTESGWWIGRQKDTEEASFAQKEWCMIYPCHALRWRDFQPLHLSVLKSYPSRAVSSSPTRIDGHRLRKNDRNAFPGQNLIQLRPARHLSLCFLSTYDIILLFSAILVGRFISPPRYCISLYYTESARRDGRNYRNIVQHVE